jgi:hypothetical protein
MGSRAKRSWWRPWHLDTADVVFLVPALTGVFVLALTVAPGVATAPCAGDCSHDGAVTLLPQSRARNSATSRFHSVGRASTMSTWGTPV